MPYPPLPSFVVFKSSNLVSHATLTGNAVGIIIGSFVGGSLLMLGIFYLFYNQVWGKNYQRNHKNDVEEG